MKLKKRYIWNHPTKLILYPLFRRFAVYTKLSFDALAQAWDIVDRIDQEEIPGAIVELGCWNGGCGALMSYRTKQNGSNRSVWLFDSFEGLPELTEEDMEWAALIQQPVSKSSHSTLRPTGYFKASQEKVHEILDRMHVAEAVYIEKGWFQNTLPAVKDKIGPIAFMRLDGDIYESTKVPLEILFDQISKGGYIVIDDFHLRGCRQAIYEFFAEHNVWPLLINAPRDGRAYFRKS